MGGWIDEWMDVGVTPREAPFHTLFPLALALAHCLPTCQLPLDDHRITPAHLFYEPHTANVLTCSHIFPCRHGKESCLCCIRPSVHIESIHAVKPLHMQHPQHAHAHARFLHDCAGVHVHMHGGSAGGCPHHGPSLSLSICVQPHRPGGCLGRA